MKRTKLLAPLRLMVATLALLVSIAGPLTGLAWAKTSRSIPSVLIIEAGLGDYEQCSLHWLGKKTKVVASNNGFTLTTNNTPSWWADADGEGDAPATFLLGCPEGASSLGPSHIAWALDQIRTSGAQPRTFVVAMGATGLRLREYAEDLANTKQSSRADIVGMAFCGTPQNGYTALELYPENRVWDAVTKSVGLSTQDLTPGSGYLNKLNAHALPGVTKSLLVNGNVGDLGFGRTDGLCITEDYYLSGDATDQIDIVSVEASAGMACNLSGNWEPITSEIDYPGRAVDADEAELLSAKYSYETAGEVRLAVRIFYSTWFSRVPVTYNANMLLLDISGSMNDQIEPGVIKLQAAKYAAKEYLRAMQAVSEMPHAAPMSANVLGFALTTTTIANGYDKASCDAIDKMTAYDETDIGQVLDKAVASLGSSPACAERRIVLLSDGESTRGQTDAQVMAGAVARAKSQGIKIDTIGFGNIGESDAGFLHNVSDATGGTYYQATDTFSLKVDFLKSYYKSLGLDLLDEEVKAGKPATISLGNVNEQTSALQVGIVAQQDSPQVKLLCNGKEAKGIEYTVQEEYGLTTIQVLVPPTGEYALELSGNTGKMHVFAVQQKGIVIRENGGNEGSNLGLILLAAAGGAMIVAIMAVLLISRRNRPTTTTGSYPGGGY